MRKATGQAVQKSWKFYFAHNKNISLQFLRVWDTDYHGALGRAIRQIEREHPTWHSIVLYYQPSNGDIEFVGEFQQEKKWVKS